MILCFSGSLERITWNKEKRERLIALQMPIYYSLYFQHNDVKDKINVIYAHYSTQYFRILYFSINMHININT